jgi:hypothetical protein
VSCGGPLRAVDSGPIEHRMIQLRWQSCIIDGEAVAGRDPFKAARQGQAGTLPMAGGGPALCGSGAGVVRPLRGNRPKRYGMALSRTGASHLPYITNPLQVTKSPIHSK